MFSIWICSFSLVFNKIIAIGYFFYKIPKLVQNYFSLKGSFPHLDSLYLRFSISLDLMCDGKYSLFTDLNIIEEGVLKSSYQPDISLWKLLWIKVNNAQTPSPLLGKVCKPPSRKNTFSPSVCLYLQYYRKQISKLFPSNKLPQNIAA